MRRLELMANPGIETVRGRYSVKGPTNVQVRSKSRGEEDVLEEWRDGYQNKPPCTAIPDFQSSGYQIVWRLWRLWRAVCYR